MEFFHEDTLSALEAKIQAQRIAFAPIAFQACRVLRDSGILDAVLKSRETGLSLEEAAAAVRLPRYGVKVLLEAGLGIGLFCLKEGRFTATKLGFFMLNDPMTRVNMDVVNDVCYRGMAHLDEAVATGTPAGLKSLGDWTTLYEGLSSLPPKARESWLAWNHYYSDLAFPVALPIVFEMRPRSLLDVGGNTGRWARHCLGFDETVQVTIADLPQQIALAREALREFEDDGRLRFLPMNILDERQELPTGFDAIWMSQFLDCFSEHEIVSILQRAARAMSERTVLWILELFWDRQPNETAAHCLQQTSLYFTCLANGNSQMYHTADLLRCLASAGLKVESTRDGLGGFHTLLECRKG